MAGSLIDSLFLLLSFSWPHENVWHNIYICPKKTDFMQILILGSSLETAIALDAKMLDQQIEVCDQIISKIKAGEIDESIEVYKDHLWWLQMHCNTLDYYKRDMLEEAEEEPPEQPEDPLGDILEDFSDIDLEKLEDFDLEALSDWEETI